MLSRRSLFSLGAASAVAPCLPALAVPSQPEQTAPSKPRRRIIRGADGRIVGIGLPENMRAGDVLTIVNAGNDALIVFPPDLPAVTLR
jgi:hypothetical protein